MSRTTNRPERQRRRPPSSPRPRPHHINLRIRTEPRPSPYVPPSRQPLKQPRRQSLESGNTFSRTRGKNLFKEFFATLTIPFPLSAAAAATPPTPSPPRTSSSDVMQEHYQHTRHPLDLRTHLTIVPSWAKKRQEKLGKCIICYEEGKHLQIKCRNYKSMKVCRHLSVFDDMM